MKGSVPVATAAKLFGKSPCWVRAGIVSGWLPIGLATRNGEEVKDVNCIGTRKGRINYYICPIKLAKFLECSQDELARLIREVTVHQHATWRGGMHYGA